MGIQMTNYKCPACGGPLQFDAATGKLGCEYCGSEFPVAEIEALYAQKDAQAAQNMEAADAEQKQRCGDGWDASGLRSDWGADAERMRVYSCPSCGAELICDATTAATSCPYCANPAVIPGQFAGILKPDYIIPFKLKKEDAIAALKKHYAGKKLLPSVFKKNNHLEEIKGVYVPFWLFDGEAEGEIFYEGEKEKTYQSGRVKTTEKQHFNIYREGSVTFKNIPVDGSKKMPDNYMDSIEPYEYQELKPFSTAYLPGYLADKYDMTAEECSQRADRRAENTMESCLRKTLIGYSTVTVKQKNIVLHRGEVKYALLPVWILTTRWKDRICLFAMNGQTGKIVGNLPVDKKKRLGIFVAVYGVTALIMLLILLFPGGLWELLAELYQVVAEELSAV